MYPVSDAFNAALLKNSRRWATKAQVLYGDSVVNVDSVIDSGYIGMDNVAVRRELHVTFVDADGVLTPSSARDLLAPKGTELRMSRGLWIDEINDYEWVPLGVFGIVEPQVRTHSDGTVLTVKGFDRVDAVRKRRFVDPWVVVAGTAVETAISSIVTSRLTVNVKTTPTGYTTPDVVFDRLSDPWAAVTSLAEAAGVIAYFDPLGTLIVEPQKDVDTGVSYTIGSEIATLMNVSRTMNADDTYSGVIVRAENATIGSIVSQLWDTNVNSPTYYLGPFGKRPFGFWTNAIITQAQADAKAAQLFPLHVNMSQEVEIYTVGTIAHDILDSVQIVDPRSKTNGFYTVISATIPLRATQEDMVRLRCRETI